MGGQLNDIFKHLIDATDCDGFRVDAIKHMEYDWVKQWADNMRKHAAFRGKNNFILFGEYFIYDDGTQASYCKDFGYSFNSALWFPMQLTMKNVFAYEQGTDQLAGRLNAMGQYGEGANNLVAFLDNHDVDRIALECGGSWEAKLHPALTFMYTALPVPCLFYGTEHGFNQDNRRNGSPVEAQADFQRETMWNYGWQWGNAFGDKFTTSPLYNHIKKLNELRELYISLRRGDLIQRWQEGGSGLFAYSRNYGEEEALVVFNTAWNNKSCSPQVGKPDGTVFINVLNPTETATVSGGTLNVSVEGKGSKIFVAGSSALTGEVTTTCESNNLEIFYQPKNGPLKDASTIYIGIGHDDFVDSATFAMTQVNNVWVYNYDMSVATTVVDFFFTDNGAPSEVDNNDGEDWHVQVADCTGLPALAFVGHAWQSPENGSLEVGDDLWLNVESWPIGAAIDGELIYSLDGGSTWSNVTLILMDYQATTKPGTPTLVTSRSVRPSRTPLT